MEWLDSGEENVSVIVAPILPGFSFGMFGGPEESANGLLSKTIAPPGSGTPMLYAWFMRNSLRKSLGSMKLHRA